MDQRFRISDQQRKLLIIVNRDKWGHSKKGDIYEELGLAKKGWHRARTGRPFRLWQGPRFIAASLNSWLVDCLRKR